MCISQLYIQQEKTVFWKTYKKNEESPWISKQSFFPPCIFMPTRTYTQGVCKMLGQTSRVSSSKHNNKKSYKPMPGNEYFLFQLKITFNNKYLNYVMFYYNWHNTVQVPSLITAEFVSCIKSQFTSALKSYTWTNARTDTTDHEMSHSFKWPGAVASGLTGTKIRVLSVFSFSTGSEYTRDFICPQR